MIDIRNQTFGNLVAVKFSHLNKRRHAIWKCQCKCGKETFAETRQLRDGTRVSCGCLQHKTGDKNPLWKGCGGLSQTQFSKMRAEAKKRGIRFDVTPKMLWELFEKQTHKCALSGENLTFNSKVHTSDGNASLDRIDSGKGYEKENIQWVHKDVNFMKSALSMQRFQELVEKIHHQFLRV